MACGSGRTSSPSPGRVTSRDGQRVPGVDLNQIDLPDPLARTLEQMVDRLHDLELEVERLKKAVEATRGGQDE